MHTVEAVSSALHRLIATPSLGATFGDWERSFIATTFRYVATSNPLTTEQTRITLAIAQRHHADLALIDAALAGALPGLVAHPVHERPVVSSTNLRREARYLGDNVIGLRFKRDPNVVALIKRIASLGLQRLDPSSLFCSETKVWRLRMSEARLEPIKDLIGEQRFHVDEPLLAYLTEATNAVGQPTVAVHGPDLGLIAVSVSADEEVSSWLRVILKATPA